MPKKIFAVLLFCLIASGFLFAQDDTGDLGEKMPRHVITIDVIPTAVSLFSLPVMNDTYIIERFILMTSLQYEHNVTDNFGMAARFGIKWFNLDYNELLTLSSDLHFRFYPNARFFFISGYLGWANLSMTDIPLFNFVTFGAKLGWRIDFDKPGGFILEPSFGYTSALGEPRFGDYTSDDITDGFTKYLIQQYIIGGFNVNLTMGFRF